MALNFPNSPTNGQQYLDTASGNRYVYDSANTLWKYASNNSLLSSSNNEVIYNFNGAFDGSPGLVFSANTLYANTINVTGYLYGNGAFLTGVSTSGGSGLANTSGVAFNGNLYFPAGNVSIGYGNDQNYRLAINGSFVANTKSFVIPHPTREGMTLRYGSLEGPENGVYVRGLCDSFSIDLPDYWIGLVHEDSITVSLTPIGYYQNLYVEHISNNVVYVSTDNNTPPYCHYHIFAERKDVEKLVVEF